MTTTENRLKEIVQSLDISPTDFVRARTRYRAVKEWLLEGEYDSGETPIVYLQGSFRLGTVVRPYHGDADGDFDIDQVCEITEPSATLNPSSLKQGVGSRLQDNGKYARMLDDEGRRCWTLIYASEDDRPGFHLDVLPAATSSPINGTQIDITDKDKTSGVYSWSNSDPNGYYRWFKSKNAFSDELLNRERARIIEANADLFDSLENVPKRLVRSSLQRAIQLMKRHRDVYFSGKDHKPISIILTTIAGHLYSGDEIYETIIRFVSYAARRHEELLKTGSLSYDGILDYVDDRWWISNPVHETLDLEDRENFADKWNEDPDFPIAFFDWIRALNRAVRRFRQSQFSGDLNLKLVGDSDGEPYAMILRDRIGTALENDDLNADDLLDLIHLGIEGDVPWDEIRGIAERYFQASVGGDLEDVFKVNYYQVSRHRDRDFAPDAQQDIQSLIRRNSANPAFVFCGNLLLGSASQQMLIDCLNAPNYSDVLSWPIVRLANPAHLLP